MNVESPRESDCEIGEEEIELQFECKLCSNLSKGSDCICSRCKTQSSELKVNSSSFVAGFAISAVVASAFLPPIVFSAISIAAGSCLSLLIQSVTT
jgi:hypothetical protein